MVTEAIPSLVLSREVHIGNLNERLKEPRVRKILDALIDGDPIKDKLGDDYKYVMDLELIRDDCDGTQFANPIYGEEILRVLTYDWQEDVPEAHSELRCDPDAGVCRGERKSWHRHNVRGQEVPDRSENPQVKQVA